MKILWIWAIGNSRARNFREFGNIRVQENFANLAIFAKICCMRIFGVLQYPVTHNKNETQWTGNIKRCTLYLWNKLSVQSGLCNMHSPVFPAWLACYDQVFLMWCITLDSLTLLCHFHQVCSMSQSKHDHLMCCSQFLHMNILPLVGETGRERGDQIVCYIALPLASGLVYVTVIPYMHDHLK